MDETQEPYPNNAKSFAKETGKTFALSLVSTAGMVGGLAVAATVVDFVKRRRSPKTPTETPTEQ